MKPHTHRVAAVLAFALVAMLCSQAALAQTTSPSLQQTFSKLKLRQLIYVEDEGGQRFKGTVSRFGLREIVIRSEGTVTGLKPFAMDRVTKISTIDSRRNGLLIGLAAGAVTGLLAARTHSELCDQESSGNCSTAFAIFGSVGTVGGAWIGWKLDDLISRETVVYSREARTGRASAPAGGRYALAANISF
jgi:hypothetical protein